MSKTAWPRNEAKRLESLALHAKNANKPLIFETGYGPSGLPHIGTFAEVARTNFVMKALQHHVPGVDISLIAFSDDMDGLRSVPENIPNHKMLSNFLGMPLSSIPDPFEIKSSFSEYMNERLVMFLDSYGFEYEFRSSTQCYKSGVFNAGLQKIMDNYEVIRKLFISTIAKDKRDAWSPFFCVCESCGKIYSTRIVEVHPQSYEVSYKCDLAGPGITPCGHSGKTKISDGKVKVGWKVDWALRWYTFGVNYEMYGKDLMSSASMSARICAILGGKPPTTYKYELFLDEKGAKISKKIGNGISMEQWAKYSPVGGLLNFLLGHPNKARHMGLPILPKIVDEYISVLRKEDPAEPYTNTWFIDNIQREHDASSLEKSEITYNLLVNVAGNLAIHDADLLYKYARRYEPSIAENEKFFRNLSEMAVAYVKDYEETLEKEEIQAEPQYFPYLAELMELFEKTDNFDELHGEKIQALVFTVPKKHNLDQKEWFKFLYAVLLDKPKGPRLGPLLSMMGKKVVISRFLGAIEKHTRESGRAGAYTSHR